MGGEELRDIIQSPVSPALWWIFVAVGAALLAVLWIVYRRRRFIRRFHGPTYVPSAAGRSRWGERLDALLHDFLSGKRDLRFFHLGLAREMRVIATEYSGEDVTSWTAADFREDSRLRRIGRLLAQWEAPSFAPVAEADARQAVAEAKEVISGW